MIAADIPTAPLAQLVQIVQAAQPKTPAAQLKVVKTVWSGDTFYGEDYENGKPVNPAGDACSLLKDEHFFQKNGITVKEPTCTIISMEKGPRHGTMIRQADGTYHYTPKKGFTGRDKMQFIVDAEGKKVRLMWDMGVSKYEPKEYEPEGESGQRSFDSQLDPQLADANNLIHSWLALADISALQADLSDVTYSFGMLPGTAVGQTVSTGISATITLDTNAAGHGWFIDSTASDNSEYLPTSDANVWIAKAGSAAEGKMDMLSVLLHEYGHALRIKGVSDDFFQE